MLGDACVGRAGKDKCRVRKETLLDRTLHCSC
jgi:hypothetical protein